MTTVHRPLEFKVTKNSKNVGKGIFKEKLTNDMIDVLGGGSKKRSGEFKNQSSFQ